MAEEARKKGQQLGAEKGILAYNARASNEAKASPVSVAPAEP